MSPHSQLYMYVILPERYSGGHYQIDLSAVCKCWCIFYRKFSVFLFLRFFSFSSFFRFFSFLFRNSQFQQTHPNSLKESLFGYFSENLGLLRFVSVFYETVLFVSVVSIQVRNTETNRKFLLMVSRNKPKQTRNRSCFGLFRFEPKFLFVCFEDTLLTYIMIGCQSTSLEDSNLGASARKQCRRRRVGRIWPSGHVLARVPCGSSPSLSFYTIV